MAEEKLLTVREVALLLGKTEAEIIGLAEKGVIPAYKVAGMYLRFKRNEIERYRLESDLQNTQNQDRDNSCLKDRIKDFFYFNDFYILSFFLLILLLIVILRG